MSAIAQASPHAVASGATNGLALNEAALIALITPGEVTKAAGSTSGSVDLSFSAASTAFDYLAQGEVLTLKYTVAIDDGDGGVTSRDFVITVTGTNDAPSIVGEVDPAPQTVIVAAPTALDVLDPGVIDNSLGLHTETFNQVTAGLGIQQRRRPREFLQRSARRNVLGVRTFRGRQRIVVRGHGGAVCRAVARRPGYHELSEHRRWRQRNHHVQFGEEHLRPLLGIARLLQLHQVLRRRYARRLLHRRSVRAAVPDRKSEFVLVERICAVRPPAAVRQGGARQQPERVRDRQYLRRIRAGEYRALGTGHGHAERPRCRCRRRLDGFRRSATPRSNTTVRRRCRVASTSRRCSRPRM